MKELVLVACAMAMGAILGFIRGWEVGRDDERKRVKEEVLVAAYLKQNEQSGQPEETRDKP